MFLYSCSNVDYLSLFRTVQWWAAEQTLLQQVDLNFPGYGYLYHQIVTYIDQVTDEFVSGFGNYKVPSYHLSACLSFRLIMVA